jgi:cytochrome d ubiquinol oxidase subunit I
MILGYVLANTVLAEDPSQLLPAREQMAFTLMVHVILVPFGVALPFITVVMNYLGLRRGDPVAMQLARRWSTVMAIQFAVGAVTGTVISLEFGLLWPGMMGQWGDVIGIAFGIEGWAFFLEAILIAIYIYGWKRMSPRAHLLVGLPLPIIGLVGAFSILSVNAWMNSPQGFTLDSHGNPTNVDISQVVFTPLLGPQYLHMICAAYMVAGFLVSSIYAVGWLRGRRDRYHRLGFLVPFTVAAIVTPVQFMVGDALARTVYQEQPVKFAAMEIVWETEPDQPEYLFGRLQPDGTIDGGIRIPGLDSFLAGFSRDTVVQGLSETPASDRPSIREANITHFAFDTMVGVGTVLLGLVLWFALAWVRRRDIPRSRWFYRFATLAGVTAVVGLEAGWISAEVGRQPWVVYEEMRVSEAVTDISAGPIWASFAAVVVIYAVVVWAFLGVLLRMKIRWRHEDAELARANSLATGVPAQKNPQEHHEVGS